MTSALQHFTCLRCRRDWSRKPVRGQRPKFCPECRAESRGNGWRGPFECLHCTEEFWVPLSAAQADKFCTRDCHRAATAKPYTPPRNLPAVRRPARIWLGTIVPSTTTRYVWANGPCGWCGETFTRGATGTPARYCTLRCRARAGKAAVRERRGEFAIAPSVRRVIYERDDWTCQLCGNAVDPALPANDKWAASLDHIECRAWADVPDHSPDNLRLTHRYCNSLRADESYYVYTEDGPVRVA